MDNDEILELRALYARLLAERVDRQIMGHLDETPPGEDKEAEFDALFDKLSQR